ncbi:MAG: hypothetical protein AAF485_27950, partial [Chloroflexota bacterium]
MFYPRLFSKQTFTLTSDIRSDAPLVPFLNVSSSWELGRLLLIWGGVAVSLTLVFGPLLALFHQGWVVRLGQSTTSPVMFSATAITLALLPLFYRWLTQLIDTLFYPEMVTFQPQFIREAVSRNYQVTLLESDQQLIAKHQSSLEG